MSTPTTKITPNSKKASEKKWLIPFLLGLVGLLLTSNLYLINLYSKTNRQGNEQISTLRIDSLNLRNIYLSALDSLNQQKTENTELNTYVDEMKVDLTKIYEEIGLKVRAGMSDDALERELNRLTTQMRNSIREIDTLRKDKVALQQKVEQIQKEKTEETRLKERIKTQRDSISGVVSTTESKLKEAAAAAAESKKQAEDKIANLQVQIAAASYISVPEVSISAQNRRRKKSESTTKSSKADYYRICFITAVNPLINKGKQVFYLRLLSDSGEPVQIGEEETKSDGQPVRYVRSVDVDYDGTSRESCINWEPIQKLQSGKYTIDIFNNNKLVGQSTFTLK